MPEDWSSLIFCVWVEVLVDVVSAFTEMLKLDLGQ